MIYLFKSRKYCPKVHFGVFLTTTVWSGTAQLDAPVGLSLRQWRRYFLKGIVLKLIRIFSAFYCGKPFTLINISRYVWVKRTDVVQYTLPFSNRIILMKWRKLVGILHAFATWCVSKPLWVKLYIWLLLLRMLGTCADKLSAFIKWWVRLSRTNFFFFHQTRRNISNNTAFTINAWANV